MKNTTGAPLAIAILLSSASGGVIDFAPAARDDVKPGETVTFTVTLAASELEAFASVDLLISSETLEVQAFDYSAAFIAGTTARADPTPFNPPRFPQGSELFVGGASFAGDTLSAPLLVGTVTIGIPASLPSGSYSVLVDFDRDDISQVAAIATTVVDALRGAATVTVVSASAIDTDPGGGTDDNGGNGDSDATSQPRRGGVCGVGMLGGSLCILLALTTMSLCRRTRV